MCVSGAELKASLYFSEDEKDEEAKKGVRFGQNYLRIAQLTGKQREKRGQFWQ
jgi:hypothetical protein